MRSAVILLLLLGYVHAESVTYGDLGTFTNDPPFTHPVYRPADVSLLPLSPDVIQTQFLLYTRDNKDTPQQLDARELDKLDTVWTNFESTRKVKVITHGFIDGGKESYWMFDMKNEFLKAGDFQVIMLNWRGGNKPPFPQAAANTQVVGAQIALLINTLVKQGKTEAKNVHLIAHSLGCHISGFAGERILGLGRISGMDPANPLFTGMDPVVRLDDRDAELVDVIHSDSIDPDFPRMYGLGIMENVGVMDFWPNRGFDMPGCNISALGQAPSQMEIWKNVNLWKPYSCNHVMAIYYYIESINTKCPFHGIPCEGADDYDSGRCTECPPQGCPRMGFHADEKRPPSGSRGVYFLRTSGSHPYCEYSYAVTLKLASQPGAKTLNGKISIRFNGDDKDIPVNEKSSGFSACDKDNSNGACQNAPRSVLLDSKFTFTVNSSRTFRPGNEYSFMANVGNDPGQLKSVSLSWEQTTPFIQGRNTPMYVKEIQVVDQRDGRRLRFCPPRNGVLPNQVLTSAICTL